jgi:hypothetical protein
VTSSDDDEINEGITNAEEMNIDEGKSDEKPQVPETFEDQIREDSSDEKDPPTTSLDDPPQVPETFEDQIREDSSELDSRGINARKSFA